MKTWTFKEIELLKENFSKVETRDELLILFPDRNFKSIQEKATKLKLKSNPIIKRNSNIKRNKEMGRDLSLENLKSIASQFLSKTDFYNQDISAYITARNNGWLNEICKHMIINKGSSVPQLILRSILEQLFNMECNYNDRKAIKPYELDVYFEKYKLAFEYNGIRWHKDDDIDFKKELCKKVNITLINVPEVFNIRNYYEKLENHIKEIIITNLLIINNTCNTKYLNNDILNIKANYQQYLFNLETVKKLTLTYNDYTSFKKEHPQLFNKLKRSNILDEYTKHMKKINFWTDELAKETIKKYTYLKELIEKDWGCYYWTKKNNKEYLTKHLLSNIRWNEELVIKTIKIYNSKKEFKLKELGCYQWIKKNKKQYLIKNHFDKPKEI